MLCVCGGDVLSTFGTRGPFGPRLRRCLCVTHSRHRFWHSRHGRCSSHFTLRRTQTSQAACVLRLLTWVVGGTSPICGIGQVEWFQCQRNYVKRECKGLNGRAKGRKKEGLWYGTPGRRITGQGIPSPPGSSGHGQSFLGLFHREFSPPHKHKGRPASVVAPNVGIRRKPTG